MTDTVLSAGKISALDPELIKVADDPADVVRIIKEAHSLPMSRQNFTEMT
jgi:hypothetical protein